MNGFPLELNLNGLVGFELNLLGLGRHDLQLNFSGSGMKLCVQGNLTLLEGERSIATWDEERNWSSLEFQKLVGARVTGYQVRTESLLELKFSKALTLQIHQSDGPYETMQVLFENEPGAAIVV